MRSITGLVFCLILVRTNCQELYTLDSTVIQVTEIAAGIQVPWEIIWGPNDKIWYTAQGKVISLDPANGDREILAELNDIYPGGLTDKRMMGLAISQNLDEEPYVFVCYTYRGTPYSSLSWDKYLKVVRFNYDKASITLYNNIVILDNVKVYDGWHIGGKLIAGPDNKLYLTIGDAKQFENPENHPDWDGVLNNALDLDEFNGKILRMNFDGTVPEDNPFAEAPFDKTSKNLIWTYGHRNTQGLVFGENGMLYYSEHGPDNDDEVGIITKGGNYGWPVVQGFCNKKLEQDYCKTHSDIEEPLMVWTPTIAPSNMEYYYHELIPEWKNSLLVGTLTASGRGNDIRVLNLSSDGLTIEKEMIMFDGQYLRIRDLCISGEGEIYFSTSNIILGSGSLGNDDKIFKISKYKTEEVLSVGGIKQSLILINPFENELEIRNIKEDGVDVKVFSVNGQLVFQQTAIQDSRINTTKWTSGMYLLYVRPKDGSEQIQKILKR